MKPIKIPEKTVTRLSIYLRCLEELEADGVASVSSRQMAERFGLNSAQVRKDLAYFGQFGVRGLGYYIAELKHNLERILGGFEVVAGRGLRQWVDVRAPTIRPVCSARPVRPVSPTRTHAAHVPLRSSRRRNRSITSSSFR